MVESALTMYNAHVSPVFFVMSGFDPIVKTMPRVICRFVLTTNILIPNEPMLAKELLFKNPTFRA